MLSREHRFHGYTSLNFVYRHGTTVRNQHMALRYARNPKRLSYRVAVIVSRKVHKSAVQRNRVRRRIYEIVRAGKPVIMPYDLVFSVYSEQIVETPPAELAHLVARLLAKAHAYDAPHTPATAPHAIVKTREEKR